MKRALSLADAIRLRSWLWDLERPLSPPDRSGPALFVAAFACYWFIGELISEFKGHDVFNIFFNADCPRVISDITLGHTLTPLSNTAPAHPLFMLLLNPIGALLTRSLDRSALLTSLLLSHTAAALSVPLFYAILRRVGVVRWFANCMALAYMASASQLVFGSLVETFSFVPLGLMLTIWLSLRGTAAIPNALGGVLTLGLNGALAPYALLAPLVSWAQRLRFGEWCARAGRYWLALFSLGALGFYLQLAYYPAANPLDAGARDGYGGYVVFPSTANALSQRARRLVAHVVAFDLLGPQPLVHQPDDLSTFMWNEGERLPKYSWFGKVLLGVWGAALAFASYSNVRRLVVMKAEARGVVILCAGWLVGMAGFFMYFGDDLFLYSALWHGHLMLWVAVGLGAAVESSRFRRALPFVAAALVLLLVIHNANFMRQLLRPYQKQAIISL